ncbi:type I-F CRISPR-associated endonuclease Cas1f [Taylorella asinigenitalis]|uniref:CRISPR-associated protein n=1 Tax=Taylorella asinigenitalis (strain MCE3) TaxID=1008459 RepID=G4QDI7_TAYAM|nr:type I-F CRISPR-associated endonuclease Cas1f [Taylorella asinigenitalis]AEP36004.1 CRISPR-associated protein [Taylorella asinigenitalis MCE3]
MEVLTDLKAIMHSKRANIYYLEHCRVMQKDGRVLYLTEEKKQNSYWNIPIANTTVILLGTGTSITQAAVRMLASAGVLIGFCGGGGTPLFSACDVEWLTPQSEYRPTQYVQKWLEFWFIEENRLKVAKFFQLKRIDFINYVWGRDKLFSDFGIGNDDFEIEQALETTSKNISRAPDAEHLLSLEAQLTKKLYSFVSKKCGLKDFYRDHSGNTTENIFLNHGNYLAYGLGACTTWVLGIPHGFAVMHGKTRRGALVFDIADLVKDAIVLPNAFISTKLGHFENDFRQTILNKFIEHRALDYMFEIVEFVCSEEFWRTCK